MSDDRPAIESTEEWHGHYCERCGAIWDHQDESCVGPRWAGRMTGGTWDCPMCEEQR